MHMSVNVKLKCHLTLSVISFIVFHCQLYYIYPSTSFGDDRLSNHRQVQPRVVLQGEQQILSISISCVLSDLILAQ